MRIVYDSSDSDSEYSESNQSRRRMGWSSLRHLSREDVSDWAWKWRCKLFPKKDPIMSKPMSTDTDSATDEKNILPNNNDDGAKQPSPPSGKDAGFGSDPLVKTMYEGKGSDGSRYEWVDYPPKQISKSATRAQERVAIKAFKVNDRDKPCIAGRYPLRYHKIEIQNPTLVAALEPILKTQNVFLDTNDTALFIYPFQPLWFCQDQIIDLYKKTPDGDPLKSYAQLLVKIMDEMFAELRVKRRHMQKSGLIDYSSVWILFPKDSVVYTYGLNSEFLAKVDSIAYVTKQDRNMLQLDVKVLSFDGQQFVWKAKVLTIPYYDRNQLVSELDCYPVGFHEDEKALTKRLIARGKKVLEYQGLEYRTYNGIAIHFGDGCPERHNVTGRVLIDPTGYNKYHLQQGSRENGKPENVRNAARRPNKSQQKGDEDENATPGQKGLQRPDEAARAANTADMLTREDELKFMSELIGGYALKNKLWVQFYVEDIEPIAWNDEAYSHLVYDDQQKDLVLSFVESHDTGSVPSAKSKKHTPMGDVIVGKGQGLIILLSGPPGTGKTLTAEAVADRTHRPLLYLQAEDLGINAATLGANIKRLFDQATDWDAVILLDEADVFMAERSPTDILRNELVSIFLRELEYFKGIIFLTTNLYHTIDTAFRSRVSLHLLFQALPKEARESVWRKFLNRLPQQAQKTVKDGQEATDTNGVEGKEELSAAVAATPTSSERPLDDADMKELSLWQLNGREIKNAVKMVKSWCDHKDYLMTLERVENGIRVTSPHASKEGDVDKDLYD